MLSSQESGGGGAGDGFGFCILLPFEIVDLFLKFLKNNQFDIYEETMFIYVIDLHIYIF